MTAVFNEKTLVAQAEFEARYPQLWSAVWCVEPYATLGVNLIPVAAGSIVDWTNKEDALAAAIKSMSLRENTEETIDGVTNKYISVCVEGVFVLLLRAFVLLNEPPRETEVGIRATENTIESIYRFRDGAWRHIWGAPIGEFGYRAPGGPPDVELTMAWVNSVK